MRLRLAIFDIDGTVVDSRRTILSAMDVAFEAVGLPRPDEATSLSVVGLSLQKALAALAPDADAATQERMVEAYRDSFRTDRENGAMPPLFPGMREVLETLRADDHLLLGVATGKSRRGLDHMIEAHGFEKYFVTIQTADAHPSKPHPSMVEAAVSETGVEMRDAIMIGDTSFDIEMGRAAGAGTGAATWCNHPHETLARAGAHRIVNEMPELIPAMAEIWDETHD